MLMKKGAGLEAVSAKRKKVIRPQIDIKAM